MSPGIIPLIVGLVMCGASFSWQGVMAPVTNLMVYGCMAIICGVVIINK